MSWGAVISTGVGLVGGAIGAGKSKKAADRAAEGEQAASAEAIARSEEAFETSEQILAPFAMQEMAASNQLAAQMGLPTGGAVPGGGAYMGGGGYGATRQQRANLENFDNVVREMMTMAQVRYKRSGYSGSSIHREAAQTVARKLDEMRRNGQLPPDYQMPNTQELAGLAEEIEDSYGGHTKMARNLYPSIKGGNKEAANKSWHDVWDTAAEDLGARFGVTYASPEPAPGDVQLGGPGGMPGQGQMIATTGAAPQAMTADMIRERAGLDMLPPEIRDQYMGELMRSAETDPELAGYLGLTPESYQAIGREYQDSPAYQAAIEQGVETVNQGAAGSGALYSGRRGEALRDVGQDVEQRYYFDAADRAERMFGRRQAERGAYMGRLGVETAADTTRQAAAYNNYMQMLQAMSAPTTATNIESMRGAAARGEGANIIGTARNIGNLELGAAGAEQAAIADISQGLMKVGSAFIDRN